MDEPTITADDRAFLAAIRAAPDDDAPRLVYADFIEERGDADRARLIRVQCELARGDADPARHAELAAWEHVLLADHADRWLGPLKEHVGDAAFRRGFPEHVSARARRFLDQHGLFTDAGVSSVRLTYLTHVKDAPAAFGACPATAHLRGLDAAASLHDEEAGRLIQVPALAGLRTLTLSSPSVGPTVLAALAKGALPELRDLDLSGFYAPGMNTEHRQFLSAPPPHLRKLVLRTNNIGKSGLKALFESSAFPNLRHLDLSNNSLGPAGAQGLANWPCLRTVRELEIDRNEIGPAGMAALADSPHLGFLSRLNVAFGRIELGGVQALARCAKLAHLTSLALGGNGIGEVGMGVLKESPHLTRLFDLSIPGSPMLGDAEQSALARFFRDRADPRRA